MKKILLLTSILTILLLSSCNKTKYGNVTFWQKTDSGFAVTVVSLNGVTSTITQEYDSAPDCGAVGCAAFKEVEIGTHNYTASDGVDSWSGTVQVTEGGCATVELY
jgi:hypothetical protein